MLDSGGGQTVKKKKQSHDLDVCDCCKKSFDYDVVIYYKLHKLCVTCHMAVRAIGYAMALEQAKLESIGQLSFAE